MWILYVIGYLLCGMIIGYTGIRIMGKEDFVPMAGCIFLWPLILAFFILSSPFALSVWLEERAEIRHKKEDLTKDLSLKTIRHFISSYKDGVTLTNKKEEKLARYTEKHIKEIKGYRFNENDSFQFQNREGMVKVTVSDFLVLEYNDFPESWWRIVISLMKEE